MDMTRKWVALSAMAGLLIVAVGLALRSGGPEVTSARPPSDTEELRGRLVIGGSSTLAPLVEAIGERFCAIHPGVEVEVHTGGSGRGIAGARDGSFDIGTVSRALDDDERDLFTYPIGRDGISLAVHRDNPVPALSAAQVVAIYTGRVSNWREVGGPDAPLVVVSREPRYSSFELFTHYFHLEPEDLQPHRLVGDNRVAIETVASEPGAIVYVSVGEAEREAEAGVAIRLLPVEGVAATSQNIRRGVFPISRPLTLVTRKRPTGLRKAFIDYALSSQVTDLIHAHSFVPYLD